MESPRSRSPSMRPLLLRRRCRDEKVVADNKSVFSSVDAAAAEAAAAVATPTKSSMPFCTTADAEDTFRRFAPLDSFCAAARTKPTSSAAVPLPSPSSPAAFSGGSRNSATVCRPLRRRVGCSFVQQKQIGQLSGQNGQSSEKIENIQLMIKQK